jgi:hypothetical protein
MKHQTMKHRPLSANSLRIPFEEAIAEKRLLKNRWDELSVAQQVALKCVYGLPLETANELQYWSAQQGYAEYDNLGYILSTEVIPYRPKKYREAWMIVGRRGGKSDRFASTIIAYEACYGGHEKFISRGQPAFCFLISQDLRNAAANLHFVRAAVEAGTIGYNLIDQPVTRYALRLKNGLTIACLPPTTKAVRGFANPISVFDEIGIWYQEADSANPDFEVYRAVRPGQMQFPDALIVGISSPYNKAGLLYSYWEAGTDGHKAKNVDKQDFRNVIVIHGPTAALGNPLVTRESLEDEQARDPKAFEREVLAVFQDSVSGFLNTTLLKAAVDRGLTERPYNARYTYVAAIDPAFRNDAFGFSIFHMDENGMVVQDAVRRYVAPHGQSLNPSSIFTDLQPVIEQYHVAYVFSDQYHLESLAQIAPSFGFMIEGVPFKASNKAQIFGSLQMLLNQGRLKLLDDPTTVRELASLEKKLTQTGVVQIHAPQGQHDDMACVCALCCYKVLWMFAGPELKETGPKAECEVAFEKMNAQIQRKRWLNQKGLYEE